jgi:hypothetical protein
MKGCHPAFKLNRSMIEHAGQQSAEAARQGQDQHGGREGGGGGGGRGTELLLSGVLNCCRPDQGESAGGACGPA